MAFLFWLFWALDLLFAVFLVGAGRFRSSFGASTDLQSWLLLAMIGVLGGGLVLRFVFKLRLASLIVVALPLLALLFLYIVDKARGKA